MWKALLKGCESDLEGLAELFKSPNLNISRVDDEFHLGSSDFQVLLNASDVHNLSLEMEQDLKRMGKLFIDGFKGVSIEKILKYDNNGNRRGFVFVSLEGRLTFNGSVNFTVENSEVVNQSVFSASNVSNKTENINLVKKALKLSKYNRAVNDALAYLEGELNWITLYKIYEIIKFDCGPKEKDFFKQISISSSELKEFTKAANALERHHSINRKFQKNYMSLIDAQKLILRLIREWIDKK